MGADGEQHGWKGKVNAAFESQLLERIGTGPQINGEFEVTKDN